MTEAVPPPETPGFLQRTLQLPFSPTLWHQAASMSSWSLLLSVYATSITLALLLAGYRAYEVRGVVEEWIAGYDEQWDPIVYEDGLIRVDGDRIVHFQEDDLTILVDPEETVPMSNVRTGRYLIVREDRILNKSPHQPLQENKIAELGPLLGPGPIVIDEESLASFVQERAGTIQVVAFVVLGLFMIVVDAITCPLYALVAAALLFAVKGKQMDGGLLACFRIALAASSLTILLNWIRLMLGVAMPPCSGPFLWSALLAGLGFFAIVLAEVRTARE